VTATAAMTLQRSAAPTPVGTAPDHRPDLAVRFERAIDGIWLEYQPIVHASTGAVFGAEALVRSGEPSLPDPPALLDAAIDLARLAMLGRKIRSLGAAAFAQRVDAALFINLHPADLDDVELFEASSPLSAIAPRVILEVTERASLERSATLPDRLLWLRALGFRLAVDDLGAGYSGLSSFTELRPEIVKIDTSLVRNAENCAWKQRTILALVQLCHDLGTVVVAEGVETDDVRDTLVELGCDLLQGHVIGRPCRWPPH
jgi:EAL domain-containing protein (putative c-di-GMP-specific phosphodiesterase class I)